MTTKSLSSITIIYTIGNLTSKLISFVLIFVITFFLSKEEVGSYDIILTTINLFIPILNLQITDSILRWLLDNNSNDNKRKVLSNSIIIFILNSIVFSLIYLVVIQYIPGPNKFLIYFLLLLQSFFPILQMFIRGIGRNITFAIIGVIYSFFYTVFTLISLIILDLKVEGLIIANILATLFSIIFVLIYGKLYDFFSLKDFSYKFSKELISFSIPIIPNSYSWWLFSSANRYIILYFLGLEFSGIWAISYKLPTIFTIFSSIFFMAWQEKSIKEFNNPNRDKYFSDVLNKYLSLSFGIIILIVASSKLILSLIVEKSFVESWKYTSFLLIASLFQSLSLFYGVGYLYAKETKKIFYTTLLGSLVTIFLCFTLIELFGLYGVAFASVIGFFVMFFIRLKQTKLYFNIKFPIKNTLLYLFCLGICDMLNYTNSIYFQILNIVFAFLVFYFGNRLFIHSKSTILITKLVLYKNGRKK